MQASQCDGFSYGAQASVVAAYGLSGCSVRAYLLRGMWHLPRSGIELMSPALAGRFPTDEQPRDVPRIILMEEM